MQYSPDGKHLTVVQVSGQIVVFDVVSGKQWPITSGLERDLYPHNIAISPDSKLLAIAISNEAPMTRFRRTVRLWELETGKFLRVVHDFLIPDGNDESYGNVVAAMAFSRDGKTLALSTEGEITLHDHATADRRPSAPPKTG
jgi:WD40 repeat protein